MSPRSTVALTALITMLVCTLASTIFLLAGVLKNLIVDRQNAAVQQFALAIEANARKTDNQTQFTLDADTTVYCMVQDTQVMVDEVAPTE